MAKRHKQHKPKPHSLRPVGLNQLKMRPGFPAACRTGLMAFCLAGLVFLIYSNSLHGPFIFDDMINIEYNPHVRLSRLTLDGLKQVAFHSHSPSRPVANISFALNYYVHGQNTFGFHLVNVLIHFTAGIFLYFFVRTTLLAPALRAKYENQKWIAFIAALIWLVHPLQTQSVTYIVQRMNSMAAMFYIMAMYFYARGRLAEIPKRRWLWWGSCAAAGILSFGTKQIAATLPFFIFLYEWYFFQDLNRAWLKRRILPLAGVLIIFGMLVLAYLGVDPLDKILVSYDERDFTLLQRVLTQFRVVIFYISLLLLPHPSRLNLDRDFALSYSPVDPITTLLCMAAIIGLLVSAGCLAKKQRLASFCILWFLGNLVIESSVIALEIIFDHRTYLPSMLACLPAVVLLYPRLKPGWLGVGVLAIVVTVFSFWTHERNTDFRSHVAFWQDVVAKSPHKARPHVNLGTAFVRQHSYEAALVHFSEALRLQPDFFEAHIRMADALASLGRLDEASEHYQDALDIRPAHASAHFKLANLLNKKGLSTKAIAHYQEALRIDPGQLKAHNNLGTVFARQGNLQAAIAHFAEALKIRPDDLKALINMGNAVAGQGRYEEAAALFARALKINPKYRAAQRQLKKVQQLLAKKQAMRSDSGRPLNHSN